MPKVKTFYPKASKPTVNYKEKKSPLTSGAFYHAENFTIKEIDPSTQVWKLKRHQKKMAKRIKNLIERRGRNPSEAAELEAKQRKAEAEYSWAGTRIAILEKRMQTQDKRLETITENKKKEEEQYKKNLEKRSKYPETKPFISPSKPNYKRVGNKLKPIRMKRFSRK